MDEWKNKMWSVDERINKTKEYYPAFKKDTVLSHVTARVNPEDVT